MSEDEIRLVDLRPRLTDVIREVSAGQSFVITRYGQPIARIGPPDLATLVHAAPAPAKVEHPPRGQERPVPVPDEQEDPVQPLPLMTDRKSAQAARDLLLSRVNRKPKAKP